MMMTATTSHIGVSTTPPHGGSPARRRTIERLALALLVIVVAAVPASAQNSAGSNQEPGTVRWDDGTIRFGDAVRLDPHARFQTDLLLNNSAVEDDDAVDWPRRRISLDGQLFKIVEFQIERELEPETPWRDIYGDVKITRAIRIRAGRFKVPFSIEQTTSGFDLDFLERATVVDRMSPGRDVGVMVHGRVVDRLVKYEAGVFRHSDGFDIPDGDRVGTLAGRVTISPIRDRKKHFTRDLEFGAAVARNQMPEGLYGLNARAIDGTKFFSRMYVNGARTRLGFHGLWTAGRVTVKGELLQLSDQRKQQAVTGEDLSDLIVRGSYLTAIWRAYGKHSQKGPAVDISARFDRISFGSANQTDEAFTNPRADHLAPLSQRTLTVGATWIVNRYLRVQGNAVRQQLVDPLGVRELVDIAPWTSLLRVQFGL